MDLAIRFALGGFIVSLFSVIGDILRPKSLSGITGAAPSVALATLGLTMASEGMVYAASEGRSMIAGAIGFLVYASVVSYIMMHRGARAKWLTLAGLVVWFAVTFAIWAVGLRA